MRYYDDEDDESTKENSEIDKKSRETDRNDASPNDSDTGSSYYGSDDNKYNINGKGYRNTPVRPANKMATISMMCGLGGTLLLCGCVSFPLSIILGVAAICLSILSKKGQPFTGPAIAGLVLGIISLVFGIAEGLYIIAVNFMLQDPNIAPIFDQILEQYSTSFTQ